MYRILKSKTKKNRGGRRKRAANIITHRIRNHVHNSTEINKINCNPASKRAAKDTCFAGDTLEKIKEEYNLDHQADPVLEKDPEKLWQELNRRFSGKCAKEDCWLKQIKSQELRDRLAKLSFAPKQPREWKKNKNEWLSNFDIADVMKQYEDAHPGFHFIGPTPIDFDSRPNGDSKCVWQELCAVSISTYVEKKITKLGIVFNLDKHDESGSHWVSMYVDMDRDHPFIFYFDSAGGRIPREISALVKKITKQGQEIGLKFRYFKNSRKQHQRGNTECGMYSIFFIVTMLTEKLGGGVDDEDAEISLEDRSDLFLHGNIPDEYIQHYRDLYYNRS